MNRVERAIPWLLAALAVVAVAFALAAHRLPTRWGLVLVVACAIGGVQGRVRSGIPAAFVVILVVAAVRLAVVPTDPPSGGIGAFTGSEAVADIFVGLGIVAMLWFTVHRRQGGLSIRDQLDVISVTLAAALISWLLIASPLIADFGTSVGTAAVAAAYLPSSVLVLTFTVDLLLSGLAANRTMRLIVLAALANVAGAVTGALRLVESVPDEARAVSVASFCAAAMLLAAALSHRDAPGTFSLRRDHRSLDTPARLAVMALTLVTATTMLATSGPTSGADKLARAALSLALACVVAVRLMVALRDHSRAQEHLRLQVSRDELTGLPTRRHFTLVVEDVLEATWRSGRHPSIIQVNLDRFKKINDTFGQDGANNVLQSVAARLDEVARAFGGSVGRIAGDDFAVLDGSTGDTTEALERAADVRAVLAAPFEIDDATVFVTASIGVVTAPRNRTISAEELMRRANIATDRAKDGGRNRVVVFDDSMQASLARRMDVEHALHGAIGRCEMRLYHQPIVDVASGRVSGFEALIRWQRSDGTLVPPADFISIAEETGVICELGAWALQTALSELRGWIEDGIVGPDSTMSVNVSPRQIADPNFAAVVQDALHRSGMPSESLWLEMTETMMLEEPELARTTLWEIREMGVGLALDDFGTGFSSLSLLQQFPIQRIKVDRAFVQGMAEEGNDQSLVRTIIAMAQSMGLDLVAEGVETIHQLELLREMNCAKAQGFLISRPVPPDAMRSTMGALAELASLSLFDDARVPRPVHDDGPLTTRDTAVLIGNVSTRPLGQPRI